VVGVLRLSVPAVKGMPVEVVLSAVTPLLLSAESGATGEVASFCSCGSITGRVVEVMVGIR